jgi:glycine cleavage system H lipoate-binding protein
LRLRHPEHSHPVDDLEAQARLAFVRESLAKAQGQEPEPPAAPAGALAPDVYYRNDDLWITLADTHALVRCPRSGAARQVWRSEDPSVVTVGLHQERIDAWDEDISVVALAPAGTEVERGERFGTAIDADGEEHALLSPFSGEIVTVNPEVVEDPMAPGSDWLHGGWLIQLRLDDLQPLENHSHPRPFDDEDEEREFFEQLMDDHTEGDTLLAIAIATELSTTFVAQRLISLGLLER